MKIPSKSISIVIATLLLAGLVAWLAGAFRDKIPPGTVATTVITYEGQPYTVTSVIEDTAETSTGTISARDETSVSARILATIDTISVRAGDTVKQGDPLVELDARDLKARLGQVNQTVAAARAALEEVQSNHDRISALYERQVVSRAELDRATAALKARQANYQRSRQQLQEAETSLSFTSIKSPIDGKVIERFADPGDTARPGEPLLKIYNPSLLRLDAQVRESLAAELQPGTRLSAHIDAIDKTVTVIVDEIVPSADPGSRSITAKAILPATGSLYPGMFGRLIIPTGKIERIYIPTRATSRMGQLEFVEVYENGQSSKRYIRTGARHAADMIEVLSGLQAGEVILLPNI